MKEILEMIYNILVKLYRGSEKYDSYLEDRLSELLQKIENHKESPND